MKSKIVALSLLLILLMSPLSGIVFAQEDTGDGGVDDGTGDDGTGDDGTGDDGTGDDGTGDDGTGDDGTGDDGTGEEDGTLDPVIYEQIRQQSRERFQELYTLMFGGVAPEPTGDDGTGDDGTGDDGTGDDGTGDDGTGDDGTGDDGTGDDGTGDDGTGDDGTGDDGTGDDGTGDDGTGDEELPPYNGPVIPDDVDPALRNQFMSAWSAMEGAEEKENPRAAANQYLRAMKQLRNAYRKYQADNPEVVDDLAVEGEEGVPEGELPEEPTPEELDEVQTELVGRFQERFQERVTQMLQNYNDVEETLSTGDAVKAFDALTKAEAKLLRIQERIAAGEVDEALDDLDGASEELDDDLEDLEDDASAQMFKTMNKLEARISKMVEQAERKAAKGEDTSDLDEALAVARGNKDKTKDDFKEDKGNSDKTTGNDKDTGKPDDKGKPEKEDNPNKGGKKDK